MLQCSSFNRDQRRCEEARDVRDLVEESSSTVSCERSTKEKKQALSVRPLSGIYLPEPLPRRVTTLPSLWTPRWLKCCKGLQTRGFSPPSYLGLAEGGPRVCSRGTGIGFRHDAAVGECMHAMLYSAMLFFWGVIRDPFGKIVAFEI